MARSISAYSTMWGQWMQDPVVAGVSPAEGCLERFAGVVEAELTVADGGDRWSPVGRGGVEDLEELLASLPQIGLGSRGAVERCEAVRPLVIDTTGMAVNEKADPTKSFQITT